MPLRNRRRPPRAKARGDLEGKRNRVLFLDAHHSLSRPFHVGRRDEPLSLWTLGKFWGNSGEIAALQCRCTFRQIENYRQRISGPLLDRIDLHVKAPLVNFRELTSNTNTGESSETIRQRVIAGRNIQLERFRKSSNSTNSSMGSRQVRQHCKFTPEANGYLEHAMEEMNFSARAHDRILKVA